jgi:hypothetical protein
MTKIIFDRRQLLQLALIGSLGAAIAGCTKGTGFVPAAYAPPARLRNQDNQHDGEQAGEAVAGVTEQAARDASENHPRKGRWRCPPQYTTCRWYEKPE